MRFAQCVNGDSLCFACTRAPGATYATQLKLCVWASQGGPVLRPPFLYENTPPPTTAQFGCVQGPAVALGRKGHSYERGNPVRPHECSGSLAGWTIGWLVVWLVGWLVSWSVGCCVGWSVDWLVGWLVGWLVRSLVGWLVNEWVGCLIRWLVGWSVGWLIGCIVGWVGDLLVGDLISG